MGMSGFSFKFLVLILFSGGVLNQLNQAPPRDLASLVSPKTALRQLSVPDDEASLIALIRTRGKPSLEEHALRRAIADLGAEEARTRQNAAKRLLAAGPVARPYIEEAARSDDPEVRLTARELLQKLKAAKASMAGDTEYVKKLYAVRALEEMKSRKAIPALEAMAKGRDITLRAAAAEALAAIRGDEVKRPSGVETLKWVSERLPKDVGFVGLLDLERNRRARTIRDSLKAAFQKQGKPAPAVGLGLPQIQEMLGMLEEGVPRLLALTGNIRVDSVTMLSSERLGERRAGYIAWVFKGLWDPARLRAACAGNLTGEMEVSGHKVFFERYGGAFCFPDEHTAVISVGPGRDGEHIREVVEALSGKRTGGPPRHLAWAFERVGKGKERLAAAGKLSEMQKVMLKEELGREVARMKARIAQNARPHRQVELAACEMLLRLADVAQFSGRLTPEGKVVLQGECARKESAEKLGKSLIGLEEQIRALAVAELQQMPPQFKAMLGMFTKDMKFWESRVEGKTVTAEGHLEQAMLFLAAF